MNEIITLHSLYAKRGYLLRSGLHPAHFNCNSFRNLPFTSLFRDGRKLGTGGGISFLEMFFVASLCREIRPSRIFVIGNAFGVSTILLALANPNAQIVTLDAGIEGLDNDLGNGLTETIAREENLPLKVIRGTSPCDVDRAISDHLGGTLDLVLIDGRHTNEQQDADFEACWRWRNPSSVFLFHDVVNFRLRDSFQRICAQHSSVMTGCILWRTPSGMGILHPRTVSDAAREVIQTFTQSDEVIRRTKREVQLEKLPGFGLGLEIVRLLPRPITNFLRRLVGA